MKNIHGGVLVLVACNFTKISLLKLTLLHGYFSRFLNCTNGTKSRNAPHLLMKKGFSFKSSAKLDDNYQIEHFLKLQMETLFRPNLQYDKDI